MSNKTWKRIANIVGGLFVSIVIAVLIQGLADWPVWTFFVMSFGVFFTWIIVNFMAFD